MQKLAPPLAVDIRMFKCLEKLLKFYQKYYTIQESRGGLKTTPGIDNPQPPADLDQDTNYMINFCEMSKKFAPDAMIDTQTRIQIPHPKIVR